MQYSNIRNVLLVSLAGIMLSGCACLKAEFPTPQQKLATLQVEKQALVNQDCNTAPMLYANLKLPVTQRIYFLDAGDICNANS